MKKYLYWLIPGISLIVFIIWTVLVKTVDVSFNSTIGGFLGFSNINNTVNSWVAAQNNPVFDILSTVLLIASIVTVGIYATVGLVELIKRKSLGKVDPILYILLGLYVVSLLFYVVFELYKVTYSPLSTANDPKASYPSSHIFISISYMWAAMFVAFKYVDIKKPIRILTIVVVSLFTVCSVLTRLMSGNHWFTDVIGGIILSFILVSAFVCFLKWWEPRELIRK